MADYAPLEVREEDEGVGAPNPEDRASLFSRYTFQYIVPFLELGARKPLALEDIYRLSRKDNVAANTETFRIRWEQARLDGKSFLRTIMSTYRYWWLITGFFRFMADLLTFLSPFFLRGLLSFAQTPNAPLSQGIFYVAGLCLAPLVQSIFESRFWHTIQRTGILVRGAVITSVYRKSLAISSQTRQETSSGEIVNHMAVDTNKLDDAILAIHGLWDVPMQIFIAFFFLYQYLGWSVFVGVAVLGLLMPLNFLLVKKQTQYEKAMMKEKDVRIKLTNEVLHGIRTLKLLAWERSYSEKINAIRAREVVLLRRTAVLEAISRFFWIAVPGFFTASIFTAYTAAGNELTVENLFTALALLNIVRFPLSVLPGLLSSMISARVSLGRISKFLALEEVDTSLVIRSADPKTRRKRVRFDLAKEDSLPNTDEVEMVERPPPMQLDSAVDAAVMEHASFSWGKQKILHDINLRVKKGDFVCVVGEVGCGKSSLLLAFLGEMAKDAGEVALLGAVSYTAQIPWILNATVRENVLFGEPYDEARYNEAIKACALEADVAILPGGHACEIGEKGINLSGGQKQRLALARALYRNPNVYLLDDPLAAVDAHVGSHLFEKCLLGKMSGTTRIMATHQIHVLSRADMIVVMSNGRVTAAGRYDELLTSSAELRSLLEAQQAAQRAIAEEMAKAEKEQAAAGVKAEDDEKSKRKTLMSVEERATGSVQAQVYLSYMRAIGWIWPIACVLTGILTVTARTFSDYWLASWAQRAQQGLADPKFYLKIYTGSIGWSSGFIFVYAVFCSFAGYRASLYYHARVLLRVVRAPMSFFDTTPVGRVLNRFSKDIDTVDSDLPETMADFLSVVISVIGVFAVISFSSPWFLLMAPPLFYIYYKTQNFYRRTARELQRLSSVTKSPVYAHFSETLHGVPTIRAYEAQGRFITENVNRFATYIRTWYPVVSCNRWLSIRLQCIASFVILFPSVMAIIYRNSESSAVIGLSLTYAMSATSYLNWMVRTSTMLETKMNSVERLEEYSILPQEKDPVVPEHDVNVEDWPSRGEVEFKSVSMRYREGLDPVLNQLTFATRPAEKIGVCGRTGAGKSSLMLALFRLVEPFEGDILIDGRSTLSMGLETLRSRMNIIPQDPILFHGTVRANLDPFDRHTDEELWRMLEKVCMKEPLRALPLGLESPVAEGSENFSAGQRQLLCLGRAMLRRTKVIVLDECTAAVDVETDAAIQATLRHECAQATVLTIAHRINTIIDYDRVMVLDGGRIVEFDSPSALLSRGDSLFASLVRETHARSEH